MELACYGASVQVPMTGTFARLKTPCMLKQWPLQGHSLPVSTATSNLLFSGGIWSLGVSSQNNEISQADLGLQNELGGGCQPKLLASSLRDCHETEGPALWDTLDYPVSIDHNPLGPISNTTVPHNYFGKAIRGQEI